MIEPRDIYMTLMQTVRSRFDVIDALRSAPGQEFVRAESAAFHGRKILEAIAFSCLVAVDHSFNSVPRDAKGQWNAEDIFKSLQRKNLNVLPSPSIFRATTAADKNTQGAKAVIEGVPDRRLSHEELIDIYRGFHSWLHEVNPYTNTSHQEFCAKNGPSLWRDLDRLFRFVERHVMAIRNAGFFCVLRDSGDGLTKVMSISRPTA